MKKFFILLICFLLPYQCFAGEVCDKLISVSHEYKIEPYPNYDAINYNMGRSNPGEFIEMKDHYRVYATILRDKNVRIVDMKFSGTGKTHEDACKETIKEIESSAKELNKIIDKIKK